MFVACWGLEAKAQWQCAGWRSQWRSRGWRRVRAHSRRLRPAAHWVCEASACTMGAGDGAVYHRGRPRRGGRDCTPCPWRPRRCRPQTGDKRSSQSRGPRTPGEHARPLPTRPPPARPALAAATAAGTCTRRRRWGGGRDRCRRVGKCRSRRSTALLACVRLFWCRWGLAPGSAAAGAAARA